MAGPQGPVEGLAVSSKPPAALSRITLYRRYASIILYALFYYSLWLTTVLVKECILKVALKYMGFIFPIRMPCSCVDEISRQMKESCGV